ncbi:YqiA/YcfP family alpha/beta fold hydrolase [Tenacibaculum sp. UWU-22]|uniref:YqiA/YcfP family alpha/beta fold hydrolase n=1 Tax=Tenacibaculum sp. UWU-22 TaxID=3234187 RepID=UPI0034DAE09B
MSNKTPIYFVPGLGASSKIFERLQISQDKFELYYLDWMLPQTKQETIDSYAKRMCARIKHKNVILIGVSFGGVVVQEMSKLINTRKVIIISSIKSNKELPKRLKFIKFTKSYKLFPTKIVADFEAYEKYFFNAFLQKKAALYKIYMSKRNPQYLNWAIYNVLNWEQDQSLDNIIHIHGKKDKVFPIKHIKESIEIDNGTHAMILTKASSISKIIEKECCVV